MRTLDEILPDLAGGGRAKLARVHGEAFAAIDEHDAVWQALRARFELAIAEANEAATHPDTDESKRPGWCAWERGLRDLWRELEQLQDGSWRQWPEVAMEKSLGKSDEKEDE